MQVEEDVKFWLTESRGKVNVAVTVTVHSRGRISIEEWRSRGPNRAPVPRQKIEIVRHPAPNCSRASGSFRVPYEKIHTRKRPNNGSDFVLGPGEMESIAGIVWDAQFERCHYIGRSEDFVLALVIVCCKTILWVGKGKWADGYPQVPGKDGSGRHHE